MRDYYLNVVFVTSFFQINILVKMNCLPPTITDNRIRKVEKSPKIILGLTENEDNLNEEEKHDQSSKEISFLNDTLIGSYITQIEKIYCQPESLRQGMFPLNIKNSKMI